LANRSRRGKRPFDRIRVVLLGPSGGQVGAVGISAKDAAAILGRKVKATDTKRVAAMYELE